MSLATEDEAADLFTWTSVWNRGWEKEETPANDEGVRKTDDNRMAKEGRQRKRG